MFRNLFKRNSIDIKPYLKYYVGEKIPDPVKEFEEDCDMNPVDNTIICTSDIIRELPIETYTKGKNKDKDYINFDKIIPIKNRDDFSYELVEKYWGANPYDDGIVEMGINDDKEIIIWFKTMYLPPIGVINYLLSKYKNKIIWFTKKN